MISHDFQRVNDCLFWLFQELISMRCILGCQFWTIDLRYTTFLVLFQWYICKLIFLLWELIVIWIAQKWRLNICDVRVHWSISFGKFILCNARWFVYWRLSGTCVFLLLRRCLMKDKILILHYVCLTCTFVKLFELQIVFIYLRKFKWILWLFWAPVVIIEPWWTFV